MKRFITVAGLCSALFLSACGNTPEATAPLETTGFGDTPIVTDSPYLAEALGAVGLEAHAVMPEGLVESFETYRGGLVSYTPLPDDIPRIDPERLRERLRWPRRGATPRTATRPGPSSPGASRAST